MNKAWFSSLESKVFPYGEISCPGLGRNGNNKHKRQAFNKDG